jgi:hypothetical protein
MGRVSKNPDHYNPSLPVPVASFEFRPNKNRDFDGLSLYRECKLSPAKLAHSAPKAADNYVVVKLKVRDLLDLGRSVRPDQRDDDLPGHVLIPELTVAASRDPEKKQWIAEVNRKMAVLASKIVIADFGPQGADEQR